VRYCFLWSRAAVNLFSPLRQTKQTARVARNNLAPNQHVHKQSGSANIAEPVSVVMAVLVVLVESAAETPSHRRANNHINNYNIRDTEQGNHSGHGYVCRAQFC